LSVSLRRRPHATHFHHRPRSPTTYLNLHPNTCRQHGGHQQYYVDQHKGASKSPRKQESLALESPRLSFSPLSKPAPPEAERKIKVDEIAEECQTDRWGLSITPVYARKLSPLYNPIMANVVFAWYCISANCCNSFAYWAVNAFSWSARRVFRSLIWLRNCSSRSS
jgi:hypothetical protein